MRFRYWDLPKLKYIEVQLLVLVLVCIFICTATQHIMLSFLSKCKDCLLSLLMIFYFSKTQNSFCYISLICLSLLEVGCLSILRLFCINTSAKKTGCSVEKRVQLFANWWDDEALWAEGASWGTFIFLHSNSCALDYSAILILYFNYSGF